MKAKTPSLTFSFENGLGQLMLFLETVLRRETAQWSRRAEEFLLTALCV